MDRILHDNLTASVQRLRETFINANRVGGFRDEYAGHCIHAMAGVVEIVSTILLKSEPCAGGPVTPVAATPVVMPAVETPKTAPEPETAVKTPVVASVAPETPKIQQLGVVAKPVTEPATVGAGKPRKQKPALVV